jgi:hypothetical protein
MDQSAFELRANRMLQIREELSKILDCPRDPAVWVGKISRSRRRLSCSLHRRVAGSQPLASSLRTFCSAGESSNFCRAHPSSPRVLRSHSAYLSRFRRVIVWRSLSISPSLSR